ncbi:GAF domain-containing protein [Geodermatophilus arenarius]|uniref:ANTAR domain-containing protein n=1 Tax=Geodermatophilus arenarius TaxID=1137990 RepID=A0ABV9LH04_9ACTN
MTASDAATRFLDALQDPPGTGEDGPEMVPSRLARAAAQAVRVDGAALSIHEGAGLRTPIGASDRTTSRAEQLQFTAGDGPCLRAHDTGSAIVFDIEDIQRNWPELHEALLGETPYRAVFSVPLAPPLGPTVIVDLYARELATLTGVPRDDVEAVVVCLTEELVRAAGGVADEGGARWWDAPDALRRSRVWQATGLATVALGLDVVDTLAVLRAHAFATGRVVDDLADDIVAGRLDPATLSDSDAMG